MRNCSEQMTTTPELQPTVAQSRSQLVTTLNACSAALGRRCGELPMLFGEIFWMRSASVEMQQLQQAKASPVAFVR